MIYLKKFENVNSSFYERIQNFEYWDLMEKVFDITSVEFKIFKNEIDNMSTNLVGTEKELVVETEIERYNGKITNHLCLSSNLRNIHVISNAILISKIEDDYYLLRIVTCMADSIIDFKCDQIDGTIECIRHSFNLLDFTKKSQDRHQGR